MFTVQTRKKETLPDGPYWDYFLFGFCYLDSGIGISSIFFSSPSLNVVFQIYSVLNSIKL